MKNQCRGCQREISKGQKSCPICGAPQSFIRFHIKSLLFFLFIVVGFAAASQWYVIQQIQLAELQTEQQQAEIIASAQEKTQRLEIQLTDSRTALAESEAKLAAAQKNESQASNQSEQQVADLTLKLKQSEDEAKKQSDRASWLSREVARLKDEVDGLKAQAEQVATTPQVAVPQTAVPQTQPLSTSPTQTAESEIPPEDGGSN